LYHMSNCPEWKQLRPMLFHSAGESSPICNSRL
jgi:hypothetical protein